jgi:hypothetical protein
MYIDKKKIRKKTKTKAPSKHQRLAAASAPPVVTTPRILNILQKQRL